MSLDDFPHVAAAIGYAEDVVDGKIVSGRYAIQACERFLNDLENDQFPYWLDVEEAEKACEFVERLPHIKGKWAKQGLKITLEPWQCFIVVNIIGWKRDSGLRRFKTIYVEVARKNAKSTLAAAIGLYMLAADGEAGAEVYSAATTRDQAKIVFNTARDMAMRSSWLGLESRVHNLHDLNSSSVFQALHAQGNTLDGYNIHCAINDELHAWTKRSVYDVLETAMGAREQPIMLNITTAGTDTSGICWDQRNYMLRILRGDVEDETYFGIIYTIDEADDWTDRKNWPKANPNFGVSVDEIEMSNMCKKATQVVSQQNAFLTKRLNVWTNSAVAWMNMQQWRECETEEPMRLADFGDTPCWAGLDLASKIDINSLCVLFKRPVEGVDHYYAVMRHYLPEAAVEQEPTGLYDGWAREGLIRVSPGNVIDTDLIVSEFLGDIAAPLKLQELGVDPMHNSTQVAVKIAQENVPVVDVRPTVLNFSEPMKWLEALVKDGRFHHDDPVLSWMISNVEIKMDQKDNIYPRKSDTRKKIDGVIALLIALNRAMSTEQTYWPENVIEVI